MVVTGPPASGKTTIAAAIAEELRLPLIAKDLIKERLYDALGVGDREWSMRLGQATYALMSDMLAQELRARRSVVVDANFATHVADAEFAGLHARWPFEALQLHCTAPPEVLLDRYLARAQGRHPGHLDASISGEVAAGVREGRWAPLALPGRCVEIDTTNEPSAVAERVIALARAHLGADS